MTVINDVFCLDAGVI